MTDLKERLEELAREATSGLTLENPSSRPGRGAGRGLAWAVTAVVVLALGAVGYLMVRDRSPDVIVAAGQEKERPAIFERPRTAADDLPAYYLDVVGEDRSYLDFGASRAGPSADGMTLYVVPTLDGVGFCPMLVPDTEARFQETGSGSGCSTFATLAALGPSVGSLSGSGGSFVHGVVPVDVTGVRVGGSEIVLEDGVFLVAGTSDINAVELIRDPVRTALLDACSAFEPMADAFEGLGDLGPDDATALRAAAGLATEPAFETLAPLLGPFEATGLVTGDLASNTELQEASIDAFQACRQQEVPGWVVAYQPPTRFRAKNLTVDLDYYGITQPLLDTSATTMLANGPGIGPVTRAAIGDTDATVFWWDRARPNIVSCVAVRLTKVPFYGQSRSYGQSSCEPRPPNLSVLSFDAAEVPPQGLAVHLVRADPDAAFATATIDGVTYVQEVRGEFVAFALPGESVDFAQYRGDGTLVSRRADGNDGTAAPQALPAGVIATWVNQTGMQAASDDVWPARLALACEEGVWLPDVAQGLAMEFIEIDGPNDAFFEQPGTDEIDLQEEAASALWVMAIQICRDSFPEEAVEAGPFFDFRQ